jgi:hypothetical protein
MAYALIQNGAVVQFPYHVDTFRADNPHISLPAQPSLTQLAEFGIVPIEPAPEPAETPGVRVTGSEVVKVAGVWTWRWTSEPIPLAELPAAKLAKRAQVTALRDAKESDVAVTPHGIVDADPTSSKRLLALQGACLTALLTGATWTPLPWTMADNSVFVVSTPVEGLQLAGAVTAHAAALHAYSTHLKGLIEAAEDFDELAAIDITSDWPE